jgi:peptide/nickel transport system ATP-binding protein
MSILQVKDLNISFNTHRGEVRATRGVNFEIRQGEVLGLVGESGCGKSVTALSILGLLPPNARVSGKIEYQGKNLITLSNKDLQGIRASEIAMVFQDPFESLNPVYTIGDQIREVIEAHSASGSETRLQANLLLEEVRIPHPEDFQKSYPHQASGGMRQRAMIAMALAANPSILIADEPTTALDVTTQAQIMSLFEGLKKKRNLTTLLITHDLALVSEVADRVAVMYAGRIVEVATRDALFSDPQHPYTRALLQCVPKISQGAHIPETIPGEVPDPQERPSGCAFHPRCALVIDQCRKEDPELFSKKATKDHQSACWVTKDD